MAVEIQCPWCQAGMQLGVFSIMCWLCGYTESLYKDNHIPPYETWRKRVIYEMEYALNLIPF
jgi:hypothetical protein